MNEEKDTSPMITSRRIERPIQIEERNDPPSTLFDTTVVYPSTALPEWFTGLQSIVEDETFTQLVIILGEGKVRYFLTVAAHHHEAGYVQPDECYEETAKQIEEMSQSEPPEEL